jgi:hypothetical protein
VDKAWPVNVRYTRRALAQIDRVLTYVEARIFGTASSPWLRCWKHSLSGTRDEPPECSSPADQSLSVLD